MSGYRDYLLKPIIKHLLIKEVSVGQKSVKIVTDQGIFAGDTKGHGGTVVNWEQFLNKVIIVQLYQRNSIKYIDVSPNNQKTTIDDVFTEKKWNKVPSKIYSLIDYLPFRNWEVADTSVVDLSKLCWTFKRNENQEFNEKIINFVDEKLIKNIIICSVPPHKNFDDPGYKMNCMLHLTKELARRGRTDASSCLRRTKEIEPLHQGGSRDIKIHYASIEPANEKLVANKTVLLLDDVSTSGNSLLACEKILKTKCGVKEVFKLAIWKTIDLV